MTRAELYDVAERALWTFVQAFFGALTINTAADLTDRKMLLAAATAGLAAVVSLVKGVLATRFGAPGAGTLPRSVAAGADVQG